MSHLSGASGLGPTDAGASDLLDSTHATASSASGSSTTPGASNSNLSTTFDASNLSATSDASNLFATLDASNLSTASGASNLPTTFGAPNSSAASGASSSSTLVNASAVAVDTANISNAAAPTLPADETELYIVPGTNRLTLSAQKLLIHVVVQDAIKNLHTSLLFEHAFLNALTAIRVIRKCLLDAAERYKPGASAIHERLMVDKDYMTMMVRLLCPRIPLLRSEAKERCNVLVMTAFSAIDSPTEIVKLVQKQLTDYTYTFPKAPNASGLVLRAQPYRNEQIINVIQDAYFSGFRAFATDFHHKFLSHPGSDGESCNEITVPMLSLVATALYMSLYEWRSGRHMPAEFSANLYLDVYDGHMNTLNFVLVRHPGAYHSLMADLYAQASVGPFRHRTMQVPIAELNIEELED